MKNVYTKSDECMKNNNYLNVRCKNTAESLERGRDPNRKENEVLDVLNRVPEI